MDAIDNACFYKICLNHKAHLFVLKLVEPPPNGIVEVFTGAPLRNNQEVEIVLKVQRYICRLVMPNRIMYHIDGGFTSYTDLLSRLLNGCIVHGLHEYVFRMIGNGDNPVHKPRFFNPYGSDSRCFNTRCIADVYRGHFFPFVWYGYL